MASTRWPTVRGATRDTDTFRAGDEVASTRDTILFVLPDRFADDRGHFAETFNGGRFSTELGFSRALVQDNRSCSRRGEANGCHHQVEQRAKASALAPCSKLSSTSADPPRPAEIGSASKCQRKNRFRLTATPSMSELLCAPSKRYTFGTPTPLLHRMRSPGHVRRREISRNGQNCR
jgi:hypothetical protein